MYPVQTTIEITRGELDEAEEITLQISGEAALGTPDTYWHPGDPAEAQVMQAVVVESEHPQYPVGTVIELTFEEREKAESALIAKAGEEANGFEPPDPEWPDIIGAG